jgi:hypothetical protein
MSKRNNHHKSIVKRFGITNIEIYLFNCSSENEAFEREIRWIAQLRRDGVELVNQTNGGEGASGAVRSDESRAKMRIASKGRNAGIKQSIDAINRRSISLRKKWEDPEYRAKALLAHIGAKRSCEARARMSAAQLARYADPLDESRRKISEAAKLRFSKPENRKKQSDEAKAKNSESLKKKWMDSSYKKTMSEAAKRAWSDPVKREKILNSRIVSKQRRINQGV